MGLKAETEKATKSVAVEFDDAVKIAKRSVQDSVSKEKHVEAAHAESEKRKTSSLSPGSEMKSVGAELGDDAIAEVDLIRQTIRKDV